MGRMTQEQNWHSVDEHDVASRLDADALQGLTTSDAQLRLTRHGENRLPEAPPTPTWKRFLRQFNNLLIHVLLVAAALAGFLQEWLDMVVVLTVVLANATIGYLQEGRAERALNSIRVMLSSRAVVLRDAQRLELPATELVPGDLVLLEAGDKVPADLRLIKARNLQIQEAALTGESVAVEKHHQPVPADSVLGDRFCMAYSGTLVTQGQGRGLVVATGADTELGRINRMLSEVSGLTTPLLRQMAQFARYITLTIVVLAVLVFVIGLFQGHEARYLFMAVVSLVVAAIPEGLPTILTVAMAIGVTRMAQRHAIIRRLPAVETLGSVTVICSDKTGTLTRNEMTVAVVALAQGDVTVEGVGYAPTGDFRWQGAVHPAESMADLGWLAKAGALCNDAALLHDRAQWRVEGDPMEGALLTLSHKAGQDLDHLRKDMPRVDAIPFDSRHKFMATLHHDHHGKGYILVKGAPERLLEICSGVFLQGERIALDRDVWKARIDQIAAKGQRVLGLALRLLPNQPSALNEDDLKHDVLLLGLVGLIDPPREEAVKAIAACQAAGIRVKMITGDHAATALAIGAQLHLENTVEALTGAELDRLDDAALAQRVQEVDIFARTSPEHKLRLVQALQAQHEVVAMTGDGVNDAPALKRADVGVAMGKGGTEAAKEASAMVLTDDNFATIVNAVHAGRTVYDNLRKAVVFLLPINGGESLAIMLALLMALTLPILPLQILWVNMVSSVGLALALAFEPSEANVMKRRPRSAEEGLLTGFLVWRVLLVSVLFTLGIFGMFEWARSAGLGDDYARTLAVNTLVAMEVWYLFSVRYLHGPSLSREGIQGTGPVLLAAGFVLLMQLGFTYLPFMHTIFASTPVSLAHGSLCVLVGIAVFAVLEIEKWIMRQRS